MSITKGEWLLDEMSCHGAINSGGKHIAMVNCYESPQEENRVSRSEQLRNAYLISASPNMLNALEFCVEAIRKNLTHAMVKDEFVLLEAYETAMKAILKAKGLANDE